MDGWPNYWPGLPPMWYATHCVGPVSGLARRAPAEYVSCFGSGTIRKELIQELQQFPFAVETAHIKYCHGSDVSARIIRQPPSTPRGNIANPIDVYGSKASVEWPLIEHEPLVLHTAKLPEPKIPKLIKTPDFAKRLPKPIQAYTTGGVYGGKGTGKKSHRSFVQGGPTVAATRTSPTRSSTRSSATAIRSRTRSNPPTGPAIGTLRPRKRPRLRSAKS